MKAILFSVCLGFVIGGASLAKKAQAHSSSKPVTVEIKNVQGQNVGTAVLSEAPRGVKIKIDIKNFPPGQHSIHIHQTASASRRIFPRRGRTLIPTALDTAVIAACPRETFRIFP